MDSRSESRPLRILISDGDARASLAAVRSLGAAGHEVHVASRDGRSLAGASRFARADHPLPDPAAAPEAFGDALERLVAAEGIDLFLPITEITLGCVYELGLQERIPVVCPDRRRYEAAVDKHGLMERAAALGIDVPRSVLIDEPAVLDELPDGFSYPVVVKARVSRFLDRGRWRMGRVGIAHGPEELRELCRDPGMACGALLQEFVPGHGEAIFLLSRQGESLAVFAHRRLRERPPSGGVSVLRESIAPDPDLLRDSERLLADLGWTGVAMVEYRRAPDGRAVLMEINPRLWGSLQLAIDSGVDFPTLQLALHRGEVCRPRAARLGVRTRWLMGDVDHVLIALRKPRELESLGKSRWQVVRDFLAGFFDGSRLEVLRPGDPRPFLRELRIWVGELLPRRAPSTSGCEDQEPTCA